MQNQLLKKLLILFFCLWHMAAVVWWTLPHSFGGLPEENSLTAKLFEWLTFDDDSAVYSFLQHYIDVTGSQQYWDFFAPHSPKFHQYLSVCDSIARNPMQGTIACVNPPLFTNLDHDFASFSPFKSDKSRLYRLTENFANLENPALLKRFADYYRTRHQAEGAEIAQVYLVVHLFELHPELKDLPPSGYRMDRILWVSG